MNRLILILPLLLLPGGCSEDLATGDLVVENTDGTAGNNITDIYIARDCTDSWGNADAVSLGIAPGSSSQVFVLDTRVYDVLACFTSGTCGQVLDVEVHNYPQAVAQVQDDGIAATPLDCN